MVIEQSHLKSLVWWMVVDVGVDFYRGFGFAVREFVGTADFSFEGIRYK